MLAALLFGVYALFSNVLYLEFVTITIILYAINIPKWDSLIIVSVFVLLIWLCYGISPWSAMYMVIYPLFALVLKLLSKQLKKSIYLIAFFAFFMALCAGNLIDLPFLLLSREVTIMYFLIGIKTTLVQGGLAFIEVLILYEPLSQQFIKLIEKGDIYV